MPKADSEHTPTRRKFLGHLAAGTAAVAVAAGASSVSQAAPLTQSNPDAELIALCAQHDEIEARSNALWKAHPDIPDWLDDVFGDLYDDQHDIGRDILDLEVTTLAGAIAVAKTFAAYRSDWLDEPCDRNHQFIAMLVRGLVGLEGKV
jgi:hypothetical protein